MVKALVVREHAELTTEPVEDSLSRASIPEHCFDWLLEQFAGAETSGKPVLRVTGRKRLKLQSFVGFVQCSCGTSIEILPKHIRACPDESALEQGRKTLLEMISVSMELPTQDAGSANLRLLNYPLPEWIYGRFLLELDRLYKRGLRFTYETIEEESRFLRGQLNTTVQLRQPPGRAHCFSIRHEIFTPNRPENRLLKLALNRAREQVKQADNWRLASELSHLLDELPASQNASEDFKHWGNSRLLASYQSIRPWCELIIRRLSPLTQKGNHEGVSLLFPMEQLFEKYVAHCLRKSLKPGWHLQTQASAEYLCTHRPHGSSPRRMFRLIPDIVLSSGASRQIVDTKWKILDGESTSNKYGLKQSDFYQMFAYGQKYLRGSGELMLIYPKTDTFKNPLPIFEFDDKLRLWVVPFDIETGSLVGEQHADDFPSLYEPRVLSACV